MFLKNYTSNVPVSQTIYRIEQVLIKCGVSGIAKEYTPNGSVAAITFKIELEPEKPMRVRLPVNEKEALMAMWLDYADGEKLTPDGNAIAWNRRKTKTK